jgi:hypothetical protein
VLSFTTREIIFEVDSLFEGYAKIERYPNNVDTHSSNSALLPQIEIFVNDKLIHSRRVLETSNSAKKKNSNKC